jgi:hypothetical protein
MGFDEKAKGFMTTGWKLFSSTRTIATKYTVGASTIESGAIIASYRPPSVAGRIVGLIKKFF